MFVLNKIVWLFLNPMAMTLFGAGVGAVLLGVGRTRARRRFGALLLVATLALLWFAATLPCLYLLGLPLERPYLATQEAASLPRADAIVVLGGGIGKVDGMAYPDMYDGADRVWHAARLWKAGKAPRVVVSGSNDLAAAVPLLLDLGVPREAILVDDRSRNTYENSRSTEKLLQFAIPDGERSVLLVTSAWHMPRACGNFARTSLKVVPAACDFSVCNACGGGRRFWEWIVPTVDTFWRSNCVFHEWLGRLARK